MSSRAVWLFRAALCLVFAAFAVVQVALVFGVIAAPHSEIASDWWKVYVVMLVLAEPILISIGFAFYAIWKLTALAGEGAAFTPRVFVWVNRAIAGFVTATGVAVILLVFAFVTMAGSRDRLQFVYIPGAAAVALFAAVTAAGFAVMKRLLVQSVAREEEARGLRAELGGVI
ncbi:DUF2975 domain-containing protein [Demequina sp. NBRC 110054]|uniref:DUF2975 domain-containing protein n=1 Tax=Demequina sp. NBRC 110054 TaxID=1570343 RepID=UPI0009FE7B55|nr:DUF2975 domain-containing protein [Demequina sp. NBRC 110054]